MRSITGALVLVLLITAVASATVTDIVGYVFYQDHDVEVQPIEQCCAAYPVVGAAVTLYKRSTASLTGWVIYDTSGITDSKGYYVFEDINAGNSLSGLCTYSNWFRVEVDATNCIPPDIEWARVVDRFSHNDLRPTGIPNEESIRVDVVYADIEYIPNSGQPVDIHNMQGHFIVEDIQGFFYSPSSYWLHRNIGTCPIEQNICNAGGCIYGHWGNMSAQATWEELRLSAYSRFIFTRKFNPDPGSPQIEIGRGYYYWSHIWPDWATHKYVCDLDVIVRDFVFHLPEPSYHENSASLFDCSDTGDLEAIQVWPNPSTSSANLAFSVSESCDVELSLFDLSGRLVSVLAQGHHEAGEYTIQTGNLNSGVYLCRLEVGASVSTTRVIIE